MLREGLRSCQLYTVKICSQSQGSHHSFWWPLRLSKQQSHLLPTVHLANQAQACYCRCWHPTYQGKGSVYRQDHQTLLSPGSGNKKPAQGHHSSLQRAGDVGGGYPVGKRGRKNSGCCVLNVATLAKAAWQTRQKGCLSHNSNANVSQQECVSLWCIFVNTVMASFSHISTG